MRPSARPAWAATLALALSACATLDLQTDTAGVDGERYLFFRPWMHYTVEGSGPPMLLVHGFPGDHTTWRALADPLAKYFEVFTLDLAGFGGSVNPYQDYTLEFFSSQVATFIREMDLGPTIVAGHSTGGAVALDAFLRFPEQVQSVVLLNSAGFDAVGDELKEDLDRMGAALFNYQDERDLDRVVATVVENPLRKLYTDDRFRTEDEAKRWAVPLRTEIGRRAHLEMLRNFKTKGLIGRLMAKADELRLHSKSERRGERDILVIWGAKDPWFPPRMAEYFRARIPGAKVAIIQDTGHFPHVEQPDLVAGLVVDVMLPRPVADNRYSIKNYDADYLIELGRTHKRRKEWDQALEAFNKALDRNPYLGLAYYEIGDLLFQKQQFAEALEMLHRSLQIYPHNAMVHYRMGTTYHNQATELESRLRAQGTDEETIGDITGAKLKDAVASYERSAELDPSKPNPWYNLGRIYTEQKKWADAARVYAGLAKADPSNTRAHRMRVDALMKLGKLEEAAAALDALAKADPRDADVRALQGRVLRDLGRLDDAAASFDQAVNLDPKEPRYALDLALVLLKLKRYDDSRIAVDRVLALNPAEPEGLVLKAALHLEAGEWAEAAKGYEQVLKATKDAVSARLGLAKAYLKLDRPKDASDAVAGLVRDAAKPQAPEVYLTAARAYARQIPEQPTKKQQKLVSDLTTRAVEQLGRAVDAGQSPAEFKTDEALAPLRRDARFKAVLKRKPPAPPEPVADEPAADDDDDDDDDE